MNIYSDMLDCLNESAKNAIKIAITGHTHLNNKLCVKKKTHQNLLCGTSLS